jgi:hypothetical protein
LVPTWWREWEELFVERVIGLAVRLQQMAAPGEIVLPEDVHRLVGDAVSVEPLDPQASVDGRGSTGPLRLLWIAPPAGGPALSHVPLIGRDRERAELRQILDRAVADRIGRRVGIVGEAGIGKTALVEESLQRLEASREAKVLRVRCRPAQEIGATWPLAEIVEQAAGIGETDRAAEARGKLEALFDDAPDRSEVEWMAGVIALPGAVQTAQETPRALSAVLSQVAGGKPLVVWLDDADRVEPSFWHLIRGVSANMLGVPLVVLCAARELPPDVEGSGDLDIAYRPLAEKDLASGGGSLGGNVWTGDDSSSTPREQPFVAEHLLACSSRGSPRVGQAGSCRPLPVAPPTPRERGGRKARLDVMPGADRGRAVGDVGEVFVDLVAELLPQEDRPALAEHLEALAGKGLILRDAADGDREWFKFRHALVREAAATYVRNEARAEVHEHCATWLEHATGDRAPRFAEAIASRLVSAFELQTGLEHAEEQARELGERAAGLLEGAAHRAGQLGDGRGAFLLLHRASGLLPPSDPRRSDLLLRSAIALDAIGDPSAAALLADAASSARNIGERGVEWRARVLLAKLGLRAGCGLEALERAHDTVDRAIEAFEEVGDEQGLSWALSLRGAVYLRWGNLARCAEAMERAAEHAGNAGLVTRRGGASAISRGTLNGPLPVADAIAAARRSVSASAKRVPHGRTPKVCSPCSRLAGHMDEACRLASGALSALEDLGLEEETALCRYRGGVVDVLAGELEAAETSFRRCWARTGSMRDASAPRPRRRLAHVVAQGGRARRPWARRALRTRGGARDLPTQVGWRTARARRWRCSAGSPKRSRVPDRGPAGGADRRIAHARRGSPGGWRRCGARRSGNEAVSLTEGSSRVRSQGPRPGRLARNCSAIWGRGFAAAGSSGGRRADPRGSVELEAPAEPASAGDPLTGTCRHRSRCSRSYRSTGRCRWIGRPGPKGMRLMATKARTKQLGQILLEQGLLSDEQLAHALDEHRNTPKSLGRVLIDLGYIRERDLVSSLAKQVGLEFIDLNDYRIDAGIATMIPEAICRRYRAIAIDERDGKLLVAMSDPANVYALDDIRTITGARSSRSSRPPATSSRRSPSSPGWVTRSRPSPPRRSRPWTRAPTSPTSRRPSRTRRSSSSCRRS